MARNSTVHVHCMCGMHRVEEEGGACKHGGGGIQRVLAVSGDLLGNEYLSITTVFLERCSDSQLVILECPTGN